MSKGPKVNNELSDAASQMGKKGGAAVLKKRGIDHFIKMGQIAGSQKEKDDLRQMGSKGGAETYSRYGAEHYRELSRRGKRKRDANRMSYEDWVKQQEATAGAADEPNAGGFTRAGTDVPATEPGDTDTAGEH